MPPPLLAAAPSGSAWLSGLTLLVGAAAIYLLLPRPKQYPTLWGVLLGVLALGLAGVLFVPSTGPLPETVLFYSFSGIALIAGALLVTQQNPARAALSFALVVLATCGIFLLLAAPFLMAATIIIYAGAIVVTFLFVIMLAQQEGRSNADDRSREPLLSTFTAFLLLFALLYVLQRGTGTEEIDQLVAWTRNAQADVDDDKRVEEPARDGQPEKSLFKAFSLLAARTGGWEDIRSEVDQLETKWAVSSPDEKRETLAALLALGLQARARTGLLSPPPKAALSGFSGPPANTPSTELRSDPLTGVPQVPADNSAYLGRSLFTDYLLPVELGGLLLLVATIGAIAIAHRQPAATGPEVRG
jgi:NADH-quinone oxidoreductase subunit J